MAFTFKLTNSGLVESTCGLIREDKVEDHSLLVGTLMQFLYAGAESYNVVLTASWLEVKHQYEPVIKEHVVRPRPVTDALHAKHARKRAG